MFTIRCTKLEGWSVWAIWYGEFWPVFRPDNGIGLEILDIRDCKKWVELNAA